jgi:hypothetical protein
MPIASATPLPLSECSLSWSPMSGIRPSAPSRIFCLSPGLPCRMKPRMVTKDQQQREQRDERVVGDQRGQLAGLIFLELLDNSGDEAQARASLLAAIEGLKAIREAHRSPPSGRPTCCALPLR